MTFTDENQILLGAPTREVTARELFQLMGRADLVQRSDSAIARRNALFISAGATLVVTMAAGVAVWLTGPNLVSGPCNSTLNETTRYFNEVCVPAHAMHTAIGSALVVGGAGVAGVLAAIGFALRPDVLSHWQLQKLIDDHNGSLAARASLVLSPVLGPNVVGAAATGRF